ncbi:GIY-YIG nuclease family protein [Armatimonas sp.]|uniref:GIY-YIG nuclease family protein n=1 Tax=Armatimonas sp. TaxID=1872638 RepID=UPI0037516315
MKQRRHYVNSKGILIGLSGEQLNALCEAGMRGQWEEHKLLLVAEAIQHKRTARAGVSHLVGEGATRSGVPEFVYLVQADNGLVKIGRTRNIKNRLSELRVGSPCELELLVMVKALDCVLLEQRLHRRFAKTRVRGEWFRLSMEDIEYVRRLTSS